MVTWFGAVPIAPSDGFGALVGLVLLALVVAVRAVWKRWRRRPEKEAAR